jgi:hypothetical protein
MTTCDEAWRVSILDAALASVYIEHTCIRTRIDASSGTNGGDARPSLTRCLMSAPLKRQSGCSSMLVEPAKAAAPAKNFRVPLRFMGPFIDNPDLYFGWTYGRVGPQISTPPVPLFGPPGEGRAHRGALAGARARLPLVARVLDSCTGTSHSFVASSARQAIGQRPSVDVART